MTEEYWQEYMRKKELTNTNYIFKSMDAERRIDMIS